MYVYADVTKLTNAGTWRVECTNFELCNFTDVFIIGIFASANTFAAMKFIRYVAMWLQCDHPYVHVYVYVCMCILYLACAAAAAKVFNNRVVNVWRDSGSASVIKGLHAKMHALTHTYTHMHTHILNCILLYYNNHWEVRTRRHHWYHRSLSSRLDSIHDRYECNNSRWVS